jgi:hypothetical protein
MSVTVHVATVQGTIEWLRLRMGRVTASRACTILTPGGKLSKSLTGTALRIIDERRWLARHPSGAVAGRDDDISASMVNGLLREPAARAWYELVAQGPVQQVGFVASDDGWWGYSPDGLVGDDGLLEVKSPDAHTHLSWLLDGVLPAEHRPQCHFGLWVTGRRWLNFLSWHPDYDENPLLVRIEPDEYTQRIGEAMEEFRVQYADIERRLELPPVHAPLTAEEPIIF